MTNINRRDFLKLGLVSLGAMAFIPARSGLIRKAIPDFQQGIRLGRVFHTADVKSKPNPDSTTVKTLYQDSLVEWHRDLVGEAPSIYSTNRRWVETPEGFVAAIDLQPVQANVNIPLTELPQQVVEKGMWAEVTVPYVELTQANPPAKSPLLIEEPATRFYYSQVFWVNDIMVDEAGNTLYHVLEKHGSYGDEFWADARAFKPITEQDIAPISPEVEDKKIIVDLTHQTLSCFEGKREILYTRVSTGAKFNSEGVAVDAWSTPVGDYHVVNRKFTSIHMGGGSAASGYELFGVCWTSIFASGGVALHSTFWHNNYGEPMSHGCVNINPDDAKFIFRWTLPEVPYEEGRIEQLGYAGTSVQVIEDTL